MESDSGVEVCVPNASCGLTHGILFIGPSLLSQFLMLFVFLSSPDVKVRRIANPA